MRKITGVLVLSLLASCSGSPKDLGCLNDLGNAENAMSTVRGAGTTSTTSDVAGALGTIKSKLADLVVVNTDPQIQSKAQDGSDLAGRLRVAVVDGSNDNVSADAAALQADINALDARCVALGK